MCIIFRVQFRWIRWTHLHHPINEYKNTLNDQRNGLSVGEYSTAGETTLDATVLVLPGAIEVILVRSSPRRQQGSELEGGYESVLTGNQRETDNIERHNGCMPTRDVECNAR